MTDTTIDMTPDERKDRLAEMRARSLSQPLSDEEVYEVVGLFAASRADQAAKSGKKMAPVATALSDF